MSSESQRREVFDILTTKMAEMFELEPSALSLETHLFEDLDLDSIDAIDLAVQLQDLTGKRVEEESLRNLRTVGDIVDLVVALRTGEGS